MSRRDVEGIAAELDALSTRSYWDTGELLAWLKRETEASLARDPARWSWGTLPHHPERSHRPTEAVRLAHARAMARPAR